MQSIQQIREKLFYRIAAAITINLPNGFPQKPVAGIVHNLIILKVINRKRDQLTPVRHARRCVFPMSKIKRVRHH